MVNTILIYPLIFTLFLNPSNLFNKSIYSSFDEGKNFYEKKNYKEALRAFLDAQVEDPGNIKLKYNIANTQYKMGNYDEAIKGYLDVAKNSKDRYLEERSYYNSGNCFYRKGKLSEAAQYYRRALALDPEDKDARYNLELVLEKLKKQQDQQGKYKEKKDENEKKNSGKDNKKKEEEKQKDKMNGEKENESHPVEERPKTASRKLSKEEAELLLNSLKEDQKNFLKEELTKKGPALYNSSKDW